MKVQPQNKNPELCKVTEGDKKGMYYWRNNLIEYFKQPYNIGDILYVKETWHPKRHSFPIEYEYKATAEIDGTPTDEGWKAASIMPKEASRIFLKVTNFKYKQLISISNEEAIKEGITTYKNYNLYKTSFENFLTPSPAVSLWSEWKNLNSYVWVIEFVVLK